MTPEKAILIFSLFVVAVCTAYSLGCDVERMKWKRWYRSGRNTKPPGITVEDLED